MKQNVVNVLRILWISIYLGRKWNNVVVIKNLIDTNFAWIYKFTIRLNCENKYRWLSNMYTRKLRQNQLATYFYTLFCAFVYLFNLSAMNKFWKIDMNIIIYRWLVIRIIYLNKVSEKYLLKISQIIFQFS